MTAEAEATPPGEVQVIGANERCGSDFMVDVLKSLDFDYICANPGSSFRGLHESFINYGANEAPELITCCHEESSVAMAHGYFKAEGKPPIPRKRGHHRRRIAHARTRLRQASVSRWRRRPSNRMPARH